MCVSPLLCLVFSLSPVCPLLSFPSLLFLFLPHTFSPSPFRPQPAPLTRAVSFSFLLHLPLALPPPLMGYNIYQSPAEPSSASCHGNRPHHSIYSLSSISFSSCPPSLDSPSLPLCLSLHLRLSLLPSFRDDSLNFKWAGWPLCEQSSEVNR